MQMKKQFSTILYLKLNKQKQNNASKYGNEMQIQKAKTEATTKYRKHKYRKTFPF